jgi:signal transduction histidine kinase
MDFGLAAYMLSAALWIGGNAAADVSYTPFALTLASQLAFFGGILNLFCFILLVDLLLDGAFPPWRRLFLYGVPCLVLSVFGFSPYGIVSLSFPAGLPAQIVPGVIYSFALFLYLGGLTYGLARVWIGLAREHDKLRRTQLLYVLVGLIVTLAGQVLFDVILPLLGELRFFTLGPIASVFFALGCGYAIARHKLLDIRIVAQRGLVYTLLLVTIVGLYVSLAVVIGLVLKDSTDASIFFSAGITVVAGIFGAPAVERYFRKMTDRIFFKDTYDYPAALHTLSGVLHANVAFADLVRESEAALARILRASSVRITLGTPLESAHAERGSLRISIELDGDGIGCIYVGPKRSGDPYAPEDVQLLRTFAYQAATALSRAQLYADAQKHAAELETKVQERTRELSEANDRERQMINDISHNLQTPLTILQTKLDQLKPIVKDDTEIRSFEQSLTGFSGFVYDLLALARLEGGRKPEYETIDLSLLLADLAEEIGTIAAADNAKVETAIAPGIRVFGDARRLREAFMNIASNALKYLKEDGARRLSFDARIESDDAIVVIRDTGIGIAAADLPHIFDRFYRGKDMPKELKGTGLGLAIAKRIVEQHAGSIMAQSELGSGTEIRIRLPLER